MTFNCAPVLILSPLFRCSADIWAGRRGLWKKSVRASLCCCKQTKFARDYSLLFSISPPAFFSHSRCPSPLAPRGLPLEWDFYNPTAQKDQNASCLRKVWWGCWSIAVTQRLLCRCRRGCWDLWLWNFTVRLILCFISTHTHTPHEHIICPKMNHNAPSRWVIQSNRFYFKA